VTGDLTIRNITRPVTLDVQVLKAGSNPRTQVDTVGFSATAMLKRSDFKLDAFVPQVSDDITLQITCQAAESSGQAAFLKAKEDKQRSKKQ
jgi:polyisoprenoid-binding protein YceI